MGLENEQAVPRLMMIRHGESDYTGVFPDLTQRGVLQIEELACMVRPFLGSHQNLMIYSSPAARALGSTDVFLRALAMEDYPVIIDTDLSPVKFKNFAKWVEYDRINSTPVYGEMWLTDPYLASDNDLAEGRLGVEARGGMFVGRALRLIRNQSIDTLALAFTHMEIMSPFMRMLYDDAECFPCEVNSVPLNAEPLGIWSSFSRGGFIEVRARGRCGRLFETL